MRGPSAFHVLPLMMTAALSFPGIAKAAIPPAPFGVADALFTKRAEPTIAEEALRQYRELRQQNPESPEAGWRLAMAAYFVGFKLRSSPEEKERLFDEGIRAGRKSAELSPDCAPCHFWTAIDMTLYGQAAGKFKMLFSLGEIRDHLKKTAELDPTYAFGGAYRLMGQIERGLPGILGGSNSRAEENFRHAIEISPDEPLNYLNLARLMVERDEERPRIVRVVETALAFPEPAADRPESRDARKELLKLRSKLSTPTAQ